MSRRWGPMPQEAPWAALGFVAPFIALAITSGSLYVASLNGPTALQVVAGGAVLACSVLAVLLRRFGPPSIGLPALAGGIAVAVTSREIFSFWPAASALLVTSAIAESARGNERFPRRLPVVSTAAGVAGWGAAGLGPDTQLLAPLLPVAVAAGAVLLLRPLMLWVERTRDLEERSAHYRSRAEASEAARCELERRASLARELHDSLGHHVTAMVVQAEAGRVTQPDAALAMIGDMGREALDELEAVLFDLRGPLAESVKHPDVDLGAIDSKLAQPLRQRGVDVQVEINTEEGDQDLLAAIFRIVQEALTNAMRHSDASRVSVLVDDQERDLVVRVEDDGVGIATGTSWGHGMWGIRERAAQFGGEAEFVRSDPHGTTVKVRVPRVRR